MPTSVAAKQQQTCLNSRGIASLTATEGIGLWMFYCFKMRPTMPGLEKHSWQVAAVNRNFRQQ